MPATRFPDSKTFFPGKFVVLQLSALCLKRIVLLEPLLSPWKDAKCLLAEEEGYMPHIRKKTTIYNACLD